MRTLLTLTALTLAVPALAEARVGAPAPAFTATDTAGKPVSLAALKGRTVVMEWHNPECPFVKKHYSGTMQATQAAAARDGVVWVTVNSGAPGKQGSLTAPQANALKKTLRIASAHYVADLSGAVGRSYGAKTTPHMYVIDPKGTLVYAGAIDSVPSADAADLPKARNYVRAALADVKAGRAVAESTSRPYGCSVKYAG